MPSDPNHIDRYELQEVLGRGAMGVVYRALDPVIGRVVALKTISLHTGAPGPQQEESMVRFAREARAAGALSHPNIVTVYDVGEIDEGAYSYIAMEFVEGRTLRQMVPYGERMPLDEILDLARQVARALDYAHRRGVVHRDVKPANILVREDGLVKLADFGVARIDSSELTRTGQSIGSPSYMAPEMLLEQAVDGRADLFSLGVILYELLTGEKPFRHETIAGLYHHIIALDPPPPSKRAPALPPEWDFIIGKLLEKSPDKRYASAGQLIEDLRCLELDRPLHFAAEAAGSGADSLELDDAVAGVPEESIERVIAADEMEPPEGRRTGARAVFHPQHKALLALLTVAGFALIVIVVAALFREPITRGTGTPAADALVASPAVVDMTVRFAHVLREGRLSVAADGRTLFTEPFRGERNRLRIQGALSRRLQIPEGRHVFKVTVQDEEGRVWNATSTREIGPGPDPTLFVELKGIVKKSLDLTWY